MNDTDPLVIHKATILLIQLVKPREQTFFTSDAMEILTVLKKRGYVECHEVSPSPEQNIWWITTSGFGWLKSHGLTSINESPI